MPRRLPDLHRSAFWLYGATAAVMREPMGAVLRHAFEAGFHDWQVRLEVLRLGIVILLLSRLFLVSGLYFEMVFMQPDAAVRYPRRSYPVDFLTGLLHFMTGAALTTVMSSHLRLAGGIASFSWIVVAFLSIDIFWLAVAVARRFSAVPVIAEHTKVNAGMLGICGVVWIAARLARQDPVFADQAALGMLAAITLLGILRQIRIYESLDHA
ncbi:MAG TPA: hypothetical protein VG297_14600 [Bryobacteraceae bacterium]|nr:hypothetical protein [Bryobacteraceae bacterium]